MIMKMDNDNDMIMMMMMMMIMIIINCYSAISHNGALQKFIKTKTKASLNNKVLSLDLIVKQYTQVV